MLQLETDADRVAQHAQADHQRADHREGDQHAQRVPHGMAAGALGAFAALRQAQHFQRQDRQHAGHQIQHQATAQRQQQYPQQRAVGFRHAAGGLGTQCIVLLRVGGEHIACAVAGVGTTGIGRRVVGYGRKQAQRRAVGGLTGAGSGRSGQRMDHFVACSRCITGGVGLAGGDRQLHPAGHRRVADAIGLAALEGHHQRAVDGLGAAAAQRHRHFHLVEIDRHVTEVLVAVRLRRRPTRLVGQYPGAAFQLQRGAVAIEVIARCRAEAQQQGVAIAGDGIEAECLFRRQRQRLAVAGARQPQATATAGAGQWVVERTGAGGACGRQRGSRTARAGQGHLHHALLRRVAHTGIGAALVTHFQADGAGGIGGRAGQGGLQALAVGLHLTEEIVVVLLACGHLQRSGIEGRIGLHRGAVAIQVITRGDLELQLDLATLGRAGGQRERLVHRQQILLIQCEGRQ
ncbi:hypothetical protein D3C81_724390 [compost metagenome]